MKKALCLCLLAGFVLAAAVVVANTAEARPPCPPGYFVDGPRGCMPYGYGRPGPYAPPPPAPYYYAPPPPPAYYAPRPCPPGTLWRHGACRPVAPPPGIGIYIGPPVYY
jgi:hypothetical protein